LSKQFSDYVVHVATGTESSPHAGDDDNAHVFVVTEGRKRVSELAVNFERKRIQAFGTIECDRRDTSL
jgi:hypothetical protein